MFSHLTDLVELIDVVTNTDEPLFDGDLFNALANVGQVERHNL